MLGFLTKPGDRHSFLDLRLGDLFNQCLKHNIAHTFHKFDAADNKVPASGDATAGKLVCALPDHTRDVHEHTP